MIQRTHWIQKIQELWQQRGIVWLSGVRRVGKTVLCGQIEEGRYFNCDLPSTQRQMADPEFFLSQQPDDATIILDEVHRLDEPTVLLKIGADVFPDMKFLATGSSTLAATKKFRDTLTGRKFSVHLFPVLWRECLGNFGVRDFDYRLIRGGFPERLLNADLGPSYFEEWLDSFFSRDISELFGVRNRTGFIALFKLLCLRSGGQLAITDLASEAEISRPTVHSYLDAMEISNAIVRLPPFHGGGHREITRQRRVYAFDTGIVAHVRGWDSIRESDRGHLWEHMVLDELRDHFASSCLHYWRDKSQREVDFVIDRPEGAVDTVEAKVNPDAFNVRSLTVFRDHYPEGKNVLMCPFVDAPYAIRPGGMRVTICGTQHIEEVFQQ